MTHEMMGRVHHKTALGCMIPITLSYLVKIQYFRDMGLWDFIVTNTGLGA